MGGTLAEQLGGGTVCGEECSSVCVCTDHVHRPSERLVCLFCTLGRNYRGEKFKFIEDRNREYEIYPVYTGVSNVYM